MKTMTNRIILKKSFAGYPVWEYQLNLWEYCCIKDWSYKIHPDIVGWMPSYFEEVEENYVDIKQWSQYYYIDQYWEVGNNISSYAYYDKYILSYWNIYKTKEWAQAVSDLRKHVYKFPIGEYGDDFYYWYKDDWWQVDEVGYPEYTTCWIHISATEEDREERLKLIEDCIRLNWYLTI